MTVTPIQRNVRHRRGIEAILERLNIVQATFEECRPVAQFDAVRRLLAIDINHFEEYGAAHEGIITSFVFLCKTEEIGTLEMRRERQFTQTSSLYRSDDLSSMAGLRKMSSS